LILAGFAVMKRTSPNSVSTACKPVTTGVMKSLHPSTTRSFTPVRRWRIATWVNFAHGDDGELLVEYMRQKEDVKTFRLGVGTTQDATAMDPT
jgi:hypothetical protein